MTKTISQRNMYDSVKACRSDSKALWAVVSKWSEDNSLIAKQLDEATAKLEVWEAADAPEITDDQLRARVRQHLIARLADKSLSAAEIGQLKDLFGLSAKSADTHVTVINYSNVCECACGAPAYVDA